MAIPECGPQPNARPENDVALDDLQRRIELADENENPIERTRKLEILFERFDQLEAELDTVGLDENAPTGH